MSENESFHTTSADTVELFTDWKMGPVSSSIDLARDDFQEILHIDEEGDGESIALMANSAIDINVIATISQAGAMRSANSDESISNILDKV